VVPPGGQPSVLIKKTRETSELQENLFSLERTAAAACRAAGPFHVCETDRVSRCPLSAACGACGARLCQALYTCQDPRVLFTAAWPSTSPRPRPNSPPHPSDTRRV